MGGIDKKNLTNKIPQTPGVYLMKSSAGKVMYVGKAGNLKRRTASYFSRAHDLKIEKLISQIKKIDYIETDGTIEALILEAKLIRELKPQYNIKEKDDKSFLYVEITNEEYPRVFLVRGKNIINHGAKTKNTLAVFGPFTSATSIRETLKIIRRIFPYSVHDPKRIGKYKRPCLNCQIGQCPGTCIGAISRAEYMKNIKNIKLFFEGKRKKIIQTLRSEMKSSSKKLDFERAEILKRRIFALQHIQDSTIIVRDEYRQSREAETARIEGYDISNISGNFSVGSMVVFIGGVPAKSKYRLFKIRNFKTANDVGMMKEVLNRRFGHDEWEYPNLLLVDGGRPQVNAAKEVLYELGIKLPVVGIAKGPTRKKNEFIGKIPEGINIKTLIAVRDEAHRFAINFHRKVRSDSFINRK